MDREQGRHPAAGLVHAPKQVAGTLRGDHPDVDDARRVDAREVDVEAVREHQQLAGPQVRGDVGVVDGLLGRVRHEDHHDVRGLDRVRDVRHAQAGLFRQRTALRPRGEPDDDVHARLMQVQRVGVALAAVADDRDGLPLRGPTDRRHCRSTSWPSSLESLLDGRRTAGHHDGPGPNQLLDPVRANKLEERVDLLLAPGHLHDDGLR